MAVLVLVGPSGCNASATLRMLAGFGRGQQGRTLIGGKDVTTMQPKVTRHRNGAWELHSATHDRCRQREATPLKIASTPKDPRSQARQGKST